jgi:hypothetical protein
LFRRLRVLCPGGAVSGGPEALHQLVHVAARLGVDARIVYTPAADIVTAPYQVYDVLVDDHLVDSPDTVVVAPEIWPTELLRHKDSRKVFWWLSWDYGAADYPLVDRPDVTHACQSHYAFDQLMRRRVDPALVFKLSDFTRSIFNQPVEAGEKEDICAFFPTKGREFSERIIAENADIMFLPIADMSPEEVRDTLRRAKVYIDFGHHPGKDRVPREAAASGCCVITASDRGASRYFEDIPVPHHFKFSTEEFSPRRIGDAIWSCMDDYEVHKQDFRLYRALVRDEPLIFEEEVRRMLVEVGCLDSTTSS